MEFWTRRLLEAVRQLRQPNYNVEAVRITDAGNNGGPYVGVNVLGAGHGSFLEMKGWVVFRLARAVAAWGGANRQEPRRLIRIARVITFGVVKLVSTRNRSVADESSPTDRTRDDAHRSRRSATWE